MDLNVAKHKIVSYSRKKNPIYFCYHIHQVDLARVNTIRDVGIEFDSKLSFIRHINNITVSALKSLGFIIRNCNNFNNVNVLKSLFYGYVMSKLIYCSPVWHPLAFKCDGHYPDRGIDYNIILQRFNFVSLEQRQVFAIKFLFNLVQHNADCSDLLSQLSFLVPRQTSRQDITFYIDTARTSVLMKSPIYVMCSYFNKTSCNCDLYAELQTHSTKSVARLNIDAIKTLPHQLHHTPDRRLREKKQAHIATTPEVFQL